MMPRVYVETPVASLLGPDLPPPVEPHVYTAEEFEAMVGRRPQDDELDRVNCPDAGLPGHWMDGVCLVHEAPRFVCGCMPPRGAPGDEVPAIRVSVGPECAPSRIVAEVERILGWPGLDAFPAVMARLREWINTPGTYEARAAMRHIVDMALMALVSRGALFRVHDVLRGGAWRYDGRGR
jgi:hypothetical protein